MTFFKFRRIAAAVIACMLLFAVPVSASAESVTAYASVENARVYNASGEVIGHIGLNTKVTVLAVKSGICLVERSGVKAYMKKSELSASKTESKSGNSGVTRIEATTFYVQSDGVKVYNSSGKSVGTLDVNDAVVITAYNADYALTSIGGHSAFIRLSDLGASKVKTQTEVQLSYGDQGDAVKKLQRRLAELGYFSGTVGGNYLELTQAAVRSFQSAAKLEATGVADLDTLTVLMSDSAPKYAPTSSAVAVTGTAKEMDWWTSGIQSIFARGTTATVTDVETGLSWKVYRSGGTNHADVQPLTAADTAIMKKAYGGSWSWARRAIYVTIDGVNYAASMNGMPHGNGSITDNNFDGHHCIHFTNSRTHGTNRVCSLHQAAIKKAAAATL